MSSRNGYVYEIDPKTAKPFAIFVGGRPGDIAHIGGLAMLLWGPPKNTVTVIDSGSGTASTPFALPGSPAASASIAVYGVDVWIANPNVHSLERVSSPYTGVARQSIPLPPLSTIKQGFGYSGLAAGEGALWVAGNDVDRTLWRVDPISDRVTAISLPFAPSAIAVGSGGVWLVDQRDNSVVRLDPATNRLGHKFRVGHEPTAVTVGAGFVWVANALDGTVSRIDPRNATVTNTKIGGKPIALAVGLGAVWVLRQTA